MTSTTTAPDGSLSDSDTWFLGVVFSIISSVGSTFGTILQKQAQEQQLALPPERRARVIFSLVMTPRWWCGLLLLVFLPMPFDAAALVYAPQSLVTPLGGVTLVLTQVLGPRMLGERVLRGEYIIGLVIVLGIVLTTWFGPKDDPEYGLDTLLALWGGHAWIACQAVFGIVTIATLTAIHRLPNSSREVGTEPDTGGAGADTGAATSSTPAGRPDSTTLSATSTAQAETNTDEGRVGKIVGHKRWVLAYAYVAGVLGAEQNVNFKAVGEMISVTLADDGNGQQPFHSVGAYLFVLVTVVFAVAQISYINQGLRIFDGVLFLPLYSAMLILHSTMFGSIFYREMEGFGVSEWLGFFFGMATTLAGCVALALVHENGGIVPSLRTAKWISVEQNRVVPTDSVTAGEPEPVAGSSDADACVQQGSDHGDGGATNAS